MVRRALIGVVLALFVIGAGTLSASADNPPPITPPGVTPPTLPEPSDPPASGPVYVITPGVGGSELPAPGDRKALEEARKADRARAAKPARTPSRTPSRTPGGPTPSPAHRTGPEVAGPQTPLATPAATHQDVGLAWRGFAALVAMVVMFEITAVRRSLRGRRRIAVTHP